MTDASPVNRYLLFNSPDEFSAHDKVQHALRTGDIFTHSDTEHTSVRACDVGADLSNRTLVRTLEELKRSLLDRAMPVTASTNNTHVTAGASSGFSSPDLHFAHFPPLEGPNFDSVPLNANDADEIDEQPWDSLGAQATYWNWPVEALYQRYHIVVAIDFSKAAFEVSRNGMVFADRIPTIINSLLDVINTTMQARAECVSAIKTWTEMNVTDAALRAQILQQVWDPTVMVSILLLNTPRGTTGFGLPSHEHCSHHTSTASTSAGDQPPTSLSSFSAQLVHDSPDVVLFPPEHGRFSAFDTGNDDELAMAPAIPILSECDARVLLRDIGFIDNLKKTLTQYESACRGRKDSEWPEASISCSLEYLVRTAPEVSDVCCSIVLINNIRPSTTCLDTLSFLEHVVRRKNLIISVVALNRGVAFDSPQLSPLSQFLSAVGGFAVQVDYWLALAAPRLNSDWCHRFDGARCLAQQTFVQLVSHFPVSSYGATQHNVLIDLAESGAVPLYPSSSVNPEFLRDFTFGGSVLGLLRTVAVARLNEGWSVLLDYLNDNTAARLVARYHHIFHRGALKLQYEMDVNRPAVCRRLFVSGTKTLVEHFCRIRYDEHGTTWLGDGSGSWLAHVTLLRVQLDAWVRAEDMVLRLLSSSPEQRPMVPLRELGYLSSFRGVEAAWLNIADISSVGVYFLYDPLPAVLALTRPTTWASQAMSAAAPARAAVRAALLQNHHSLNVDGGGADEEDAMSFGRLLDKPGCLGYIVQLFDFQSGVSSGPAGGFECRVSFLGCDAAAQSRIVDDLAGCVKGACERYGAVTASTASTPEHDPHLKVGSNNGGAGDGGSARNKPLSPQLSNAPYPSARRRDAEKTLMIRCSPTIYNQEALLLCLSTVAPRSLKLLSDHTESPLSGRGVTSSRVTAIGSAGGARRVHLKQQTISGALADVHGCFLEPYALFPWLLARALSFQWILTPAERAGGDAQEDMLATEVFNLSVMRRVKCGFQLLMCYNTTLKAVLQLTRQFEPDLTVNVLDVIEVHDGDGDGGPASLHIERIISPHRLVLHAVTGWIRDIQEEDVHIATALHTYQIFSQRQGVVVSAAGEHLRRATCIRAHVESMLPYLSTERTTLLKLRSPHAVRSTRHSPSVELRAKVAQLLSAMSDRFMEVGVGALQHSYVKLLSSSTEPLPADAQVQVATMFPIRNSTITFMLVLLNDTAEGAETGIVKVAIASLNRELLRSGLIQQYTRAPSERPSEEAGRGSNSDTLHDKDVVRSVEYLLEVFTSIYTTKQLIDTLQSLVPSRSSKKQQQQHQRTDGPEAVGAPQAGSSSPPPPDTDTVDDVVAQLKERFGHLSTYKTELDVTHFLRVVEARYETQVGPALRRTVSALFTQLLMGAPFTHPAMLVPRLDDPTHWCAPPVSVAAKSRDCASADDEDDANTVSSSSSSERHVVPSPSGALAATPPVLMKVRAVVLSGDGGVEDSFWVTAPLRPSHSKQKSGAFTDMQPWSPEDCERWRGEEEDVGESAAPLSSLDQAGGPSDMSAAAVANKSCGRRRLVLWVFVKTVPPNLFGLFKNPSFTPSAEVVRAIMRHLILNFSLREGGDDDAALSQSASLQPLGVVTRGAAPMSKRDILNSLFIEDVPSHTRAEEAGALSYNFVALPDAVREVMLGVIARWCTHIASYCLESSFLSTSFSALSELVFRTDASSATERRCASSDDALASFAHPSASTARADSVPGLCALLRFVVAPALLSSGVSQRAVLPVVFTQQATNHHTVDPIEAALNVFMRCKEEDHMLVLQIARFTYAFVPRWRKFAKCWVLVVAEVSTHNTSSNRACILSFSGRGTSSRATAALCEELRAHLDKKVTQVSQLHLLRQLRESQFASTELIPHYWGDQFCRPASAAAMSPAAHQHMHDVGEAKAQRGSATSVLSYHLRGVSIRKIPLYYKLQHQCKKIITRITSNSSRLELFNVFNREQCYAVADDEERDAFHYLRLVFVQDTSATVSTTAPSPPLLPSDRCALLVVQLFSATASPVVDRPMQKLEDFCYLLAVQELQGQLNYMQYEMISFNDLVFLQNNRLDSILIDPADVLPTAPQSRAASEAAVRLGVLMLFLNFRENKFKRLDVQNEQAHTTSNFVEHYNLEKEMREETVTNPVGGIDNSSGDTTAVATVTTAAAAIPASTAASSAVGTPSAGVHVLRFVKVVDGVTDVLVSCAVRFGTGCMRIEVEQYLTKIPAERYINGDSEKGILAELREHVEDVRAQLSFHGLAGERRALLRPHMVRQTVEKLLDTCGTLSTRENLLLRSHTLVLDDICAAILPFLIERLCGVLHLFSPHCFHEQPEGSYDIGGGGGRGDQPTIRHLPGFPWQWKERLQNSTAPDLATFYITCGFRVVAAAEDGSNDAEAPATRAFPLSHPELPISTATVEEAHGSLLRAIGVCAGGGTSASTATAASMMSGPYVVLKASLLEGMSVAMFNVRDANFLVRLLTHVVSELAAKSRLLNEVLMQRLGYRLSSAFTEVDLALHCCGDTRNVIQAKPLSIEADFYRRRMNHARFRSRNPSQSDKLTVMVEGLYNRGLIVNYTFALWDGVKALYDEYPHLSLDDCTRAVGDMLSSGALVLDESSALVPQRPFSNVVFRGKEVTNCRLAEVTAAPADALIACDYHRHILSAHVIVEAQNARSGVTEVLARCDSLWRNHPGGVKQPLELTTCIVALQMKSKEVFGARVPDFSLRRESLSEDDDRLDPTLPPLSRQNTAYAHSVNKVLGEYMMWLSWQFVGMRTIRVDPNDPQSRADSVVASRLRCRYGKVVGDAAEEVLFCPDVYYGIIPLVDLIEHNPRMKERYGHALQTCDQQALLQSPITSTGVLIVEVGLQVVHYALDFFVINGDALPPGVTAQVANELKHHLMFDSVLYDIAVKQFADDICITGAAPPQLSAQQRTPRALANLVKYHPQPPLCSVNAAASYRVVDQRVMRLKTLAPTPAHVPLSLQPRQLESGEMLLFPPSGESVLVCGKTRESYWYCGLIVWETEQLLVLLISRRMGLDTGLEGYDDLGTGGGSATEVAQLCEKAKRLLVSQLLNSTQLERLMAAWGKFLCDDTGTEQSEMQLPSYDEFELLRCHSREVPLRVLQFPPQFVFEAAMWGVDTPARSLYRVKQQLFPHRVVRVVSQKQSHASPVTDPDVTSPIARDEATTGIGEENPFHSPHGCAPPPGEERVILTFAPNDPEGTVFVAMECAVMSGAGAPVRMKMALYHKTTALTTPHELDHGEPPVALEPSQLIPKEAQLVEEFLQFLTNTMWASIVPCAQVVEER